MKIVAIDPGERESGIVLFNADTDSVAAHHVLSNDDALEILTQLWEFNYEAVLVIEGATPYGSPLKSELIETLEWSGRFKQRWLDLGGRVEKVTRTAVKKHLLGRVSGKDAEVRGMLMERWGGEHAALGTKASGKGKNRITAAPGPLSGLKTHEWAALAVAVTYADTRPALAEVRAT
jgi:hypothetical protein